MQRHHPSDSARSGWLGGYGIYQGLNLAIPVTYLKFSRDAEREADFLGLQYMLQSRIRPNSYVTFFERIQADEKRRPAPSPRSSHPSADPERIENSQKESRASCPQGRNTSSPPPNLIP